MNKKELKKQYDKLIELHRELNETLFKSEQQKIKLNPGTIEYASLELKKEIYNDKIRRVESQIWDLEKQAHELNFSLVFKAIKK